MVFVVGSFSIIYTMFEIFKMKIKNQNYIQKQVFFSKRDFGNEFIKFLSSVVLSADSRKNLSKKSVS